ncbi:MAG: ParB N-terminal domain-containing protein [Thermoplasmata archaeon]|nr:ParB N-terminal domain-containing protein [Thermoplasmata archaeon]NIS12337.1 ParB N-terminal domain-containing protein [Thermoplasmata archaeon]NIS20259.1 ParB N-terminal domain-containing protein [Thermoplasmata archaeon]NIT77603.1 ParB N-terminal domain-containing protein [Thermoplasmata archaeon]NIU49350.1 ParB N-terminal domain-containing protein [Thermoplasmata archaeon]
MTDLFRAYFQPEKHAQDIPVKMVLSDEKVDEDHAARIGDGGFDPKSMRPIVVIMHPKVEAYAVLDGHHRFHIVQGMGFETIRAAVVDDYVGLGFYLTKKGVFQPTPEFTKYIRVPLKRFVWWMTAFLKDPQSIPAGPPDKDPRHDDGKDEQGESSQLDAL